MALKFLWDSMILSTDRNNCCHKWSCMVKGSCFYPLLWLYSMWPPWEIKSKGIRRFSHPRLLVENIGFRSTPTCVNLLTCKDNYCAYHHTNFYKLFYNSNKNEAVLATMGSILDVAGSKKGLVSIQSLGLALFLGCRWVLDRISTQHHPSILNKEWSL